jgi:hypothetical protein
MTRKNATKNAARARQARFGGKYLHHRIAGAGSGQGTPQAAAAFTGSDFPEEPDLDDEDEDEDSKVDEMVEWFFENYDDPANGVPYDGREGGYQYINGGPYNARDELADHFSDVDESLREQAAKDIETSGGWEWVKRGEY